MPSVIRNVSFEDLNPFGVCRGCDALPGLPHDESCYRIQPPIPQSTPGWRAASVTIPSLSGMGAYEAEVKLGERWNGFMIPRFTPQQARRLVDDMESLRLKYDDTIDRMTWLSPRLLHIEPFDDYDLDGNPTYRCSVVGGSCKVLEGPLYCIGAYEWCWEEVIEDVEDDVIPHSPDCDGSGEGCLGCTAQVG